MSIKINRVVRVAVEFTMVVAAVLICSCSATQKIIKGGDQNLIYKSALQHYNAEEWKKAAQLFNSVDPYFVGPDREDSLQFFKARCAYKTNDYEGAIEQCDEFRRTYGRSVFLEDAEGIYTMSYYYLSPAPNRDQKMTQAAILAIDEFTSRHPNSEQCDTFRKIRQELVERLHEKSYKNAYTYFKIGRYKSSIVAFKNAMKEYPNSIHREDISFYIVASAYELAHNSIESKKEDRYLSMKDTYYTFIAEFPESERRAQVDKMLAEAESYIAKKREMEGKDLTEKKVLFWKKIFGKRDKEQKVEKVEVE